MSTEISLVQKYAPYRLKARFEAQTLPITESGCVFWLGALRSNGYGAISIKGKQQAAHRVAWELANGPIPAGLCVLHKCDIPCCVNPQHLFLGTKKDNSDDMLNKGRASYQKAVKAYTDRIR